MEGERKRKSSPLFENLLSGKEERGKRGEKKIAKEEKKNADSQEGICPQKGRTSGGPVDLKKRTGPFGQEGRELPKGKKKKKGGGLLREEKKKDKGRFFPKD